jgi:hypothetical protein
MSNERAPYSNVKRAQSRCNAIDVHEVLKGEIYKQGYENDTNFRFGVTLPATLGGPGGPTTVGFEDSELYFDSLYRNAAISDLPNGLIGYALTTINNNRDLKNIIEMTVGSFYFPRITNPRVQLDSANYQSLVLTPNAPDYFFFRRLYMQVVNMPFGQAVQASNSVQYHWEFQIDDLNSVAVRLTPLKPSFFLQRPLQTLSEIQFRFMVPLDFRAVPLEPDTLSVQMVLPATNPARFRTLNTPNGSDVLNLLIPPAILQNKSLPDTAQIPLPVIAAPGIAIFMSGARLQSGILSNLILEQLVNNPGGLFITSITNTAVTTADDPQYVFTIADINGLLAPVVTSTNNFTMVVPYRRIAFPVRFTCVKDQLTNYITVTHE